MTKFRYQTPFILNFSTQQQQIALTFLSGIGSKRARILIRHFNDLDEFFSEKKLNLAKIPGVPANCLTFKQRINALLEAEKVIGYLEKTAAQTVFFTDSAYPNRLKQCEDAPLLLYSRGNINWNPEKVVSIVGTRHATEYGKNLTQELVEGLATVGATIVSGLAYGIDLCAHQNALKKDLSTWGVLGHGLDQMYPLEHKKTAERMLESGGLITEFYPGSKMEPGNFPMRNRIVAGLSDATIVVESGETGGSLITAHLANDYSRDVFAYPGDIGKPFSKGCLKLIQQNKAHLITHSKDLIHQLNWLVSSNQKTPIQRQLFVELSLNEEKLLAALKTKAELTLDSISFIVSMNTAETSSQLLSLEFKGLVKSLPGRRYALL